MGVLKIAYETAEKIKEYYPEELSGVHFRTSRSRRYFGLAYTGENRIILSRYHAERVPSSLVPTVTHELVHLIQYTWNPWCMEVHGKLFRDICRLVSPIVGVSKHDLIWRY